MAEIRPKDLAPGIPTTDSALIFDNGLTVQKSTPKQIVDVGVPNASQADAESGASNDDRMSSLRVKQAVTYQTAGKANAAAIGITGSATNMGAFTTPVIPDNSTAKAAFEALGLSAEGKVNASDLAADGGAALVGTESGGTVQSDLDGKASQTLDNVPVINAVLTEDILTYPIGNELETYTQASFVGADSRDDKREFIFTIGANFSHGPSSGTPVYEDHKALMYYGVSMFTECKKAWVLNPLMTIKENCEDPVFVVNTEFDLNNFNKNFGDADGAAGLPAPSAYNIVLTGSDELGFRATAAAAIIGAPTNVLYNRGFMVGPNSVRQAAFDDYSDAAISYRDSGSHVIGIDLGGEYSAAAIEVHASAPTGLYIIGDMALAGIIEASTSQIGLSLDGDYSDYLISSSVFKVTKTGQVEAPSYAFTDLPGDYAARTSRLPASAKDYGAVGNGTTDDLAILQSFGADPRSKFIQNGDYYLSAEWRPAAQDATFMAEGGVVFSNSLPNFQNLVPYQSVPGPIWSQHLISKTYGSKWLGQGNIFQIGSYVNAAVSAVPVVAVFGQGRASAANSRAWGGNFVAYADNATGTAIGIELNIGVLTAGGVANGLVIASAGTAGQPLTAIQIQSNNAPGQFVDGLKFNWRDTQGLLTGIALNLSGVSGSTCTHFLRATTIRATGAEIDTPSFIVAATPATVDARVSINASTTATASVRAVATSTDANIQIRPKGAGVSQLTDSAGNAKFGANSTGIGFHGTNPIAKPSITGSRGGNAALADLLTKLAAYGLITDGTTA